MNFIFPQNYNFNSKLTIKDSSSSKTGKILSRENIFFNYSMKKEREK